MNSRNELLSYPTVREGVLYETKEHMVQFNLCERRCLIHESKRGFCKTRMNLEGKLYTLVYGDINALESRPIEIISRCKEIDPYMPLHFTRYHPAYKFSSPATKKETLEKAYINLITKMRERSLLGISPKITIFSIILEDGQRIEQS